MNELAHLERKPKYAVIRFNGYVTKRGQEDGLPSVVYCFLIVKDGDVKTINELVENQSAAFVRAQAMYVQQNQGAMIDIRLTPQDRMIVPFHNISYVTVDVNLLTEELPIADEEGIERFSDGSEPIKN